MTKQGVNIENLEKKWAEQEARQVAEAMGFSAVYVRKVMKGERKQEKIEEMLELLRKRRKKLLEEYVMILTALHNPLLQAQTEELGVETEKAQTEVYATDKAQTKVYATDKKD